MTRDDLDIEKLWSECEEWLQGEDGERAEIVFTFEGVELEALLSTFKEVGRRGMMATVHVVERERSDVDPGVVGLAVCLDAFAFGRLASIALNYLFDVGDLTLRILLTADDSELEAFFGVHAQTKLGLAIPDDGPKRERFEAIVEHVGQLGEWLEAEGVRVRRA